MKIDLRSQKRILHKRVLLVQRFSSQISAWNGSPIQYFPFIDGKGLLQARDLVFMPAPQVLEHLVQVDQTDHSPSVKAIYI